MSGLFNSFPSDTLFKRNSNSNSNYKLQRGAEFVYAFIIKILISTYGILKSQHKCPWNSAHTTTHSQKCLLPYVVAFRYTTTLMHVVELTAIKGSKVCYKLQWKLWHATIAKSSQSANKGSLNALWYENFRGAHVSEIAGEKWWPQTAS